MLVARQYASDQDRWSSKFDPLSGKSNYSRMSNYNGSPSLQSSWSGHISTVTNTENDLYGPTGEPATRGSIHDVTTSRMQNANQFGALPQITIAEPTRSVGTAAEAQGITALGVSQPRADMQDLRRPERDMHGLTVDVQSSNESSARRHPTTMPSTFAPHGTPGTHAPPMASSSRRDDESEMARAKEDGDAGEDDDDDMLDVEGEVSGRPMTAAERTAARRKMKRFRSVHRTSLSAFLPLDIDIYQVDAPANTFPHERVRKTTPP
ncbi:uncharacterized protein B0I36DRAFT_102395 [Microdochium trichocladiopsis]|uniref:Uncharacterized protein n=1 Tax=Microdochium trichocladiopsis TaxID=1682393 RepID=A0A9P9BV37_9PEZI|nr:uncharacterized protein B0I36DRAFT_102395 [Microdochium trichocladiopsis]KAH7032922.1 hypothetical protein B0I36DRAFT_102395 [Microdochium trichocladiopsis]